MIDQNIKELMQKSIDYATKNAGVECDAMVSRGESFSLSAQFKKIDKYNVSNSQVFGIRVIENQKVGIAYSESLDEESVLKTVDMALENARNNDVDEYEAIQKDSQSFIEENNAKLVQTDSKRTKDKIDLSLQLESKVLEAHEKATGAPYNGVSDSFYQSYFLNSPGSFCFQEERSVGCYSSALIKDGDQSSMHWHSEVARNFDDLNWEKCIGGSVEHAANWLNGKPIESGHYPVVFTTSAWGSVLGCFGNIFSGTSSKMKLNPLLDKLGSEIAHKEFSITDIPTYEESFIYSPFDDEGFKRSPLALFENGVYKNIYHNSKTAKYFNTKSTAHASRSARGSLGTGGTTKVVAAGSTSEADIFKGTVFEVHALDGLHSGVNNMRGDFSCGVRGYLKKDGQVIQAVKGVTLAGNFFSMIKEIEAIGDQVQSSEDKCFFSPFIRFGGLQVAG